MGYWLRAHSGSRNNCNYFRGSPEVGYKAPFTRQKILGAVWMKVVCSPTLVLTKGTKAHQRKVSSARLIVYTAHFIRAGLHFQDRVPVLSVLGLPLDMVWAQVKFWSSMDGPKSFTRLNLSVPNQFFWYMYFFHPSRAKNFRPCKWGLNYCFCDSSGTKCWEQHTVGVSCNNFTPHCKSYMWKLGVRYRCHKLISVV